MYSGSSIKYGINLTLFDGMIFCGVNNVKLFDGQTEEERLTTYQFTDNFIIYINKSFEELDSDFKS